jgi:predicted anti-sigma-YlaC factor YlaD
MAAIGDYLEGDVDAEFRVQLERHLSHCITCQVIYDSAKKTVKILADSESFDFPEAISKGITDRVMVRIRTQGSAL